MENNLVKSVSSLFLFSKVLLYWGRLHFVTMEAKFYPFQRKIPWKSLNLPKSRPTSTFKSLSLSLGKPLANYLFVQFLNISLLNAHLIKCLLCLFVSITASAGGNLFLEENFRGREHGFIWFARRLAHRHVSWLTNWLWLYISQEIF